MRICATRHTPGYRCLCAAMQFSTPSICLRYLRLTRLVTDSNTLTATYCGLAQKNFH